MAYLLRHLLRSATQASYYILLYLCLYNQCTQHSQSSPSVLPTHLISISDYTVEWLWVGKGTYFPNKGSEYIR